MIALIWLWACGGATETPVVEAEPLTTVGGLSGVVALDAHRAPGEVFLQAVHPSGCCGLVLEDRGQAAILYALAMQRDMDKRIVDGVGIWSTAELAEPTRERRLTLMWAADAHRAVLLVDESPRAVVDFDANRAYGHEPLPPPVGEWAVPGPRIWSEAALAPFRP